MFDPAAEEGASWAEAEEGVAEEEQWEDHASSAALDQVSAVCGGQKLVSSSEGEGDALEGLVRQKPVVEVQRN